MNIRPHSMVVAFDGESKCGKTTIVTAVANEAAYQDNLGAEFDTVFPSVPKRRGKQQDKIRAYIDSLRFNSISAISAGNVFRAAAYHAIRAERHGRSKESFDKNDGEALRSMLAEDGVVDILQNDPEIGSRVSATGKLPGVQRLCGSIFCDQLTEQYHASGGSNLVVVDARDPIGHLERNNLIGGEGAQIHPGSILPVYIDTSSETAAARMRGDFVANLALVQSRRYDDATREELPVVRPAVMQDDFTSWLGQLCHVDRLATVATPYRLDNSPEVTLDGIQNFAGHIASAVNDTGNWLKWSRDMTADDVTNARFDWQVIA